MANGVLRERLGGFFKSGRQKYYLQAERIVDLVQKLATKNEVVAELLDEYVQLKEELGEF